MASVDELQDLEPLAESAPGATILRPHRRASAADAPPGAGTDLLARPLERLRAALAADHVALVRWDAERDEGRVTATAGVPLLAAGMTLPLTASEVLGEASMGESASIAVRDAAAPLERLGAAAGMEVATAVPVDGTADGIAYVTWLGDAAPVAAAEWVVAGEAQALATVLHPPATAGARVIVCHGDPLVAEGIARQAERHLGVTADACSDVSTLLAAVEGRRVDLIACSEMLADQQTLADVATNVRAAGSAAPVLAVARAETPRSVADALRAGIAGYVAVSQGPDRILEVMAAVLDGRAVLPQTTGSEQVPDLTAREQEVLEGLDRGLSYVAIARELQVAPSTVKSHARQLFRKLDVSSSTAALHRARAEGLL